MTQPPAAGPRRFLDPATVARISRLDVRARTVVEGFLNGLHKSPYFGHSVEFVQHREYVAGDDPRYLDWKVLARSGRAVIKLFEEETNLRCVLVVDVSESMHYGRGPLNKYHYACTLAACLAHLVLKQHDPVALFSFDQAVRQALPPRSAQTHLDALLQALHVSTPKEKTDPEVVLRRVAEATPRRSLIVLISDLLTDRAPLFRGLDLLAHRRHDVMAFHVLDDDELAFPFQGTTRFEGLEELPQLVCDPRALRDGYLEELQTYLQEVRRGCSNRNVDYQLVRTGDPLDQALAKFLHYRMSLRTVGR